MNRSSDLAISIDDLKKLNLWLRYAIFFIVFIVITNAHADALSPNIKILILHSYHQEYPWTTGENEGFTTAIKEQYGSENVIFSTEYLDTKRIEYTEAYQWFYFEYLQRKYKGYSPDLIFCTDDNALDFLLKYKTTLFHQIPVVFCGVNNLDVQKNLDRATYTGVFEKKEVLPNLALLKKINLIADNIIFLGDNSLTHQAIEKEIKKDIKLELPDQKYIIFSNDKLSILMQHLTPYKQGVIFLTTIGSIKDDHGENIPLGKILQSITESGDFTIIAMEDVYLEKGILGGYVTSGIEQGKHAASLAFQIFDEIPLNRIKLVTQSPNLYMFNFPQIEKLGIKESTLPVSSIILNKPMLFYQHYKYRIWLTALFLLFQTAVILVLVKNISKRRKAEALVLTARNDLEKQVIERTAELTVTNEDLNNEIQERKRTEETLESQNRLMTTLLDNLQVGVFMVDAPRGTPLLANRKAKEILGRGIMDNTDSSSLSEIYQAFKGDTDQLYPVDELPIILGLKGKPHFINDMMVIQPGGKKVFLEVFGSPVKSKKGEVTASLVSFLDITARKKAEISLIEEKEFTETALNSQKDTFFLFNPETGKAVRWNKAFSDISGYTDQEITELKAPDAYFSPDDLDRAHALIKDVINFGVGRVDLDLICKDGSKIPTEYNVSMIKGDAGLPKYIISIGRDISERKKAEKDRVLLEEQLRHAIKMEAVGMLAGGIAHDFNNILGIILGNTELAYDDIPEWNPAKSNLNEIKTASLRARNIVTQLLNFSRKSESLKTVISVNDIIKESIRLLRASIPASIQIVSMLPDESDIIRADSNQIHQVLINLCTNAAHAMEDEDEGELKISVDKIYFNAEKDTGFDEIETGYYCRLRVEDTGHGMPPEIQKRIFDPYFTTKDVGKGSGMGLAVVHGIVKSHHGAIQVVSEPGKRTVMEVLLPIAKDLSVQQKPKRIERQIPTGKETILFVDDEEALAAFTKIGLEKLGYTVDAQTDPEKALSRFKSNPDTYDLVVSDMTMPRLSGINLSKKIKEIRPGIPIIISTGNISSTAEEKARKAGISAFAQKPIMISQTAKLVRKVLDGTLH